jgi:A/G-specific adenine glycosylase
LALPDEPARLRRRLLAWYDRHRRRLPWRAAPGEPADAYAVLVSEIMLQQTTVAAVSPRFTAFLARFPTVEALAHAPLEDVLHAWQGLGYYRRARALHACAQAIMARHGGVLPADEAALRALPGIGPYTAAAVAAIAFGRASVPVDGNVERVLARLVGIATPLPAAKREISGLAMRLAAADRPSDLAQALMDLGALVCTPRAPACLGCPWSEVCVGAASGRPEALPARLARKPRPRREAVAFLLRRPDGAVLFRRRPLAGLLGGMIELPASPWEGAAPVADPFRHAPAAAEWRLVAGEVEHVFTHFALTLRLATAVGEPEVEGIWARPEAFGELALPSLTRKLLAHAGLVRPAQRRQASAR